MRSIDLHGLTVEDALSEVETLIGQVRLSVSVFIS